MKVLVGVDGSSNSFAAVAFIGRRISPPRDELIVLSSVVAVPMSGASVSDGFETTGTAVGLDVVLATTTDSAQESRTACRSASPIRPRPLTWLSSVTRRA